MKYKTILMSLLLILLIMISVSAISATDITNNELTIASSDEGDNIIISEDIEKETSAKSLSDSGLTIGGNNYNVKPSSDGKTDANSIQKAINNDNTKNGDTILLGDRNFTFEKSISVSKDLTINGGTIYNSNNLSTLIEIVPKSENGPKSVTITGTTFYVNGNENIVIAKGENGSVEGLIKIANINISDCKIIPIHQDIDSDISGTALLNIESDRRIEASASTGTLFVANNLLNNAKSLKNNDFVLDDNFIISANPIKETFLITKNMSISAYDKNVDSPKNLEIILKDEDGNPLANKTISAGCNGEQKNYITDENGTVKIPLTLESGIYMYAMAFLGEDTYLGCFTVSTINVALKTTTITASKYTYKVNAKSKKISIRVRDQNKKLVANKAVTITVNGKTYSAKTNSKGIATVTVKIAKKGTYTYTAVVKGDDIYKKVTKKGTLVINGLASALTVKKYTFKRYATKKIKVTLKSGKTVLKSKKITLKVNGKTYTAKTNSKGVATVTIKLTKKGTFTYTAKFAGDNTYKATSKSAKVVIK